MILVNRIESLPPGLPRLVSAAQAEVMRMVQRFAGEYRSGANSFNAPGERMWEARHGDQLIGTCGLDIDPFAAPDELRGRVRRLCVLPDWRRRGAASALLAAIAVHATDYFAKLTAFTIDPDVVSFYMAREFCPFYGVNKRSVERKLAGPI